MALGVAAVDWATWSFSPSIGAILTTVIISLLLPILIHFYLYRKASSTALPTLLLVGPSGSGKTTLLTLLASGTTTTTQTSQVPQSALCRLPASSRSSQDRYRSENDTSSRTQPTFRLLDTPGHGKLRHHATASLSSASALKGILFVVDSAAISSPHRLSEAAEYLHDVLLLLQRRHAQAHTTKNPHPIPLLVLASKQDVFTSLPPSLVKAKLEQEIARIRVTRSKALLDSGVGLDDETGNDDEEQNWLGSYGSKTFDFTQMQEHDIYVDVVGGNALEEDGSPGKTQRWFDWIGDNI